MCKMSPASVRVQRLKLTNLSSGCVGAGTERVENGKDVGDVLTLLDSGGRGGGHSRDGANGEEGEESTREEHCDWFERLERG